ncbi:MAG: YchJ family metal-binding protein, partial [Desulfonauticus sp.]|nr:YchJ family metal-binding protein [Desulfonauticus sp.]
RSRYVAYAKQLAPYLLKTWHRAERPSQLDFNKGIVWRKLVINEKQRGRKKDRKGWVAFTACYQISFENQQIREKSFFSRDENDHWCYVNGTFL